MSARRRTHGSLDPSNLTVPDWIKRGPRTVSPKVIERIEKTRSNVMASKDGHASDLVVMRRTERNAIACSAAHQASG